MSTLVEIIPTLDVKGLSQKEEDLRELAAQAKDAFTNIGFVAVTNHNISSDVIKKSWENADKFFNLPKDVKSKYIGDSTKEIYGWAPLGAQTLYQPEAGAPLAPDYREGLDIIYKRFKWPSEVPNLKETTTKLIEEMSTLGNYVLKLMAMALNLQDTEYLVRSHNMLSDKNPTCLSFAQYPPIPAGGLVKGQMRCGEHTDWTSLTLLIQDETGGLEIQKSDGSWMMTRPSVGTVLVNIGDMMQRWTADKFLSTIHRVRQPEEEHLKQRTRRSIGYFISPDDDVTVKCLDGSDKYPPINATEYLWQKAKQYIE